MYNATMVDIHHYTFVKTHKICNIKSELNVHYGHWIIIICQCRFIDYNKCSTLVQDVDNERGCTCVGTQSMWELVPFAQICCKPKTTL